jgi:hypothetical protein
VTPKEATDQFKAAVTTAVKKLKSDLQLAKKALQSDLQIYEDAVNSGAIIADETGNVFQELVEFQGSVQNAASATATAVEEAGNAALAALADGAPLTSSYPKDFSWGTGGALDKARKDVKTQIDQLYKSMGIRIRKTVKTLAKNGATLSLELRPPAFVQNFYFTDQAHLHQGNVFSLDIILAVNRPELAEDGLIWLGGAATNIFVDVVVSATGPESESMTVSPSAVTSRWEGALTQSGTRFKKGNYLVLGRSENDVYAAGGTLSIY